MENLVRILSLKEEDEKDFEYWLNATPEEKLDTLQYLRELYYDLKHEDRKGFQRIIRIVERKKG